MTAVLSRGMRGDLVERLQEALAKIQVPDDHGGSEPALVGVDGDFGRGTQIAVQRVQEKLGLPVTGVVDPPIWKELTGTEWPDRFERALGLVAAFEGHGYTKAAGNWDNAGITWGVIGFTLITRKRVKKKTVLAYGSLRELLKEAFAKHDANMVAALGVGKAKVLKQMLDATPDELHRFAVQVSDPDKKNQVLVPEWQKALATLGEDPLIRVLQRVHAKRLYYDPALEEAKAFAMNFDMASERTDQLFFDIQVNNGGLGSKKEKPDAKAAIKALLQANPRATLSQKLNEITRVLAASRTKFSKDIKERKGTISNGFGRVHGKNYRLDGWGFELGPAPAPPPAPTPPPAPPPAPAPVPIELRLGMLALDPTQQDEQLDLSAGARKLGLTELGLDLLDAGLWPEGTGVEAVAARGVRSLSLRGLSSARGNPLVGLQGDALLHGINLMFREPVGALAVMGQTTPLNTGDHLIVARGDKCYVGLALKKTDRLHLIRQRQRGKRKEESLLDVTEIRPKLAECRLLLLYGGFGVPVDGKPGSGARWREWMSPFRAAPIVLGWFGNVRMPKDSEKAFVASAFLTKVAELEPGADLRILYDRYPDEIVQLWGQVCHDAFHAGTQRYLWLDQPIPSLELSASGAAAIGRDGRRWKANASFGAIGEKAMTEVAR